MAEFYYELPNVSPLENIVAWIPVLLSAVDEHLEEEERWSPSDFDLAMQYVEDLKRWVMEIDELIVTSDSIGDIKSTIADTIPGNALLCDGTQYLRVDYPALYAVLPAALLVDADNFIVPDLNNGSFARGGSSLGATGGEATHVLTTAEMPAHNHDRNEAATAEWEMLNSGPVPPWRDSFSGAGLPMYNLLVTGTRGGGGAHNNLPPYVTVKFYVVAQSA